MKKRVLFLCTENSCRSQMAEGILRHFYGDKFDVFSAGSKLSFVPPLAIRAMSEIGIDISTHRSKSVEEFVGYEFDYVITLCGGYAKESCPVFIGKVKHNLHWNFPDPAEAIGAEEEKLVVFRSVRDHIKEKIDDFLKV